MWTSSQVQKDIRITHLNHWPKNLINKYIHYKSNVLSTFSWLEPVLIPTLDIGIAKSGSSLIHSHPSHILCLTPCVKARKSFHGVLLCLVIMYYQTNLDRKSFWRSRRNDCGFDLEHRKMIFLSDTLADDAILSLTDHRYCPSKHSLKFRTFTVTLTLNTAKQPFHKTLQLMNMHCQTKLVAKKNHQFKTYTRNSHIRLYEPKFSYCDLDLEDKIHFSHMTLWLIMISHHTGFGYKWFSDA